MIWRAARPSRIAAMKAVAKPRLLGKNYAALTFFGYVITHSAEEAEAYNRRFGSLRNHETIHLYQARSTHDSWLCFYWKYLLFWLKASRYRRRLPNAGYWLNPFEMEAYANMYNLQYLKDKKHGCTGWKVYADMPLSQRLCLHIERTGHQKKSPAISH